MKVLLIVFDPFNGWSLMTLELYPDLKVKTTLACAGY